MSVYGASSELGKLIAEDSILYDKFYNSINSFAIRNRNSLEFLDNDSKNTYITLENIIFKYALNLTVIEDTVEFDAVIEGEFSYNIRFQGDYDSNYGYQWFGLHCNMIITDKIERCLISNLDIYTSMQRRQLNFAATMNFIPVISKNDLENEAERFLQKWCPEALSTPMTVPIRKIVEEKMGLQIIDDRTLSKDLSVFGQICFSDGMIKTFDKTSGEYINTKVTRGTVMVDPDIVFLRCLGCGYNTLAHEAYHWERHRIYATVHNILSKQQTIYHRCPTSPKGNIIRETMSSDEDWMEWQANAVAPKILMPKIQTEIKIKSMIEKYQYIPYENGSEETIKDIICELSDFYNVSKQAAKIRMIELGYPEANEVYNYDNDCVYNTFDISQIDAFDLYNTNKDFKVLFELGLFRNVEGYYVIDTDKYRILNEAGEYVLTDYSKENLDQCALQFTYSIAELFEFNRLQGVLYKQSRRPRAVHIFTPEYNEKLIAKALDEVDTAQKEFDKVTALGDETVSQIIWRYMEQKKWNSSIFQVRTGLKPDHYSKIKTKPNRVFTLPVLVSICVGLDLSHTKSVQILEKAGFKLVPEILEHHVYDYILSTASMRNIYACNEFIAKMEQKYNTEIHRLGSGAYD